MLKRIRIEVEEATAEECVSALNKYEHLLQIAEADRYGFVEEFDILKFPEWGTSTNERNFYNGQLSREITEEVIQYAPKDTVPRGYHGRRVVRFKRLDNRDPIPDP